MAEEFYDLLKRKNKNDRKKVIEHFAPLVKKIAGRIAINLPPSVEFNDLVSYGVFGLIDAVEKFDPDMNVKFEYYARTRISGSIYDALRKLDWAPRSIRIKSKEIEKAIAELEQELNRDVNDADIAKKLGVSAEELEKMFVDHRKALLLSLEGFFSAESDDEDKASFLKDKKNLTPEEKAEEQAIKETLVRAINSLVYNERLVVTLYYYNEFTLKEIAATLDLTESRVSQIHSRAIAKLKARLKKFKKSMFA
ncbi:MAG: RNA polymerase sigma factor WhiG [Candidatus Muiribacterium halophilum]|uniref:RNA polymerase sigma factor n=1 Tax=Muiribacterium halophilum TaxID=2053465 RepID=A0A2N5ZBE2_MUIH1|nr:MAG: RNA polymerase sigma factor WhiG [Candidatus Muirbacterium halophilum]